MGNISKFFEENLQLFANPQGTQEQQEKFNLYGGLAALASAVENLEHEVRNIQNQLNNIQSSIRLR
ncbi:MAG: hypothetical protein ACE14U_04135 [Candidatus Velamenicoccus archaeovorus]